MQQDVRIAFIAFSSRLVFWAAAFLSDLLLDDYDSSASLSARPCSVSDTAQGPGLLVEFADVWDTVFYDRISRCGYEYEHYFAFFPGLPKVMGLAGGNASRRVLVALVISLVSFTASMVLLYRVGNKVLKDKQTATMAVLLMCISPASVFMTMAYTESLFQMLTFAGVWLLINCDRPLLAAVPFALSCAVRSNGAINAGFFMYYILQAANAALVGRRPLLPAAWSAVKAAAGIALMAAVVLHAIQQGYEQFCESAAWQNAAEPRPYCQLGGPSLYSFIQSNYWGVGLFKYYQLKQIPNFLLAAPILLLSLSAVRRYFKHDPARFLSLGGMGTPNLLARLQRALGNLSEQNDTSAAAEAPEAKFSKSAASEILLARGQGTGFAAEGSFVFVAQLAAMALFAAIFMHVQVATRFLTTCMALYWYMAELVVSKADSAVPGKLVLVYCTTFAWVGLVLFPNFYPWT